MEMNAIQIKALEAIVEMETAKGIDETIRFLMQELGRFRVMKAMEQRQKLLAPPAGASTQLTSRLDWAIDALEFYGDDETYKRQGAKPALINADRGRRARDTLSKIAGEDIE